MKSPQSHHSITYQEDGSRNEKLVHKSHYFRLLRSLCKQGKLEEATKLLNEMEYVGPEFYGELLQGCVYERHLQLGQQIHAKILKSGDFFAKNEYIETKLVIFYAKCDAFNVSNNLFARLRKQNVFSWVAIIGLHCRNNMSEEALRKFIQMLENGILGDNFVLPNVLKAYGALNYVAFGKCVHGHVLKLASANLCALQQGKQGHTISILSGLDLDNILGTSLINFYAKVGLVNDVELIFDRLIEKDVVTWNLLISCYAQSGQIDKALDLSRLMRLKGFRF
ncbi:hypothetical protein K7X08_016662 [Anisodus acutangulus]|uniref:Pentatricopeptide repeat-containing protein n=1 Tax=Anisodus acutangulus TaxID=402998 RepID=A0A9Q1R2B3_9SOLA|nr:hypothetical protein K7X08_016662 [Anisodus acutangulus]